MIDFHTHILPGIDDGSASAAESADMAKMLVGQGAEGAVLTPHFYAYRNDLESFLENRNAAVNVLKERLQRENIRLKLYLGGEILYFDELWRIDKLESLCISGTDCIMIEMPFSPWSDSVVEGIERIANRRFTPILAHVDRYLRYRGVRERLAELAGCGALMQINADCFTKLMMRRQGIALAKKGLFNIFGSDCHNTGDRAPNLDSARAYIEKHLGKNELDKVTVSSKRILENAEIIYR